MYDFPSRVRAALAEQGMSIRAAARALNYDVSFLSRVLNGKQQPSAKLLEALEVLLGTNGELTASAAVKNSAAPPQGVEAEAAQMKSSTMLLLQHAETYGGDMVAPAAVQVWKTAQRKLDIGAVPEKEQRAHLAATAEAAEVAGWLLFDAAQWDAARAAFLETYMLARHAGDRPMQWFALDLLAMLAIERGHAGEALRIADELLEQRRLPPRVALLAQMRRGRALAQKGEGERAFAALNAAKGGTEESLSPRDPGWAWWVDQVEVGWHRGAALLDLEDPGEAATSIHDAIERRHKVRIPNGRGAVHLRIGLLSAFVESGAWREAESQLEVITPLLQDVRSGRNCHTLRVALHAISRNPSTPVSLSQTSWETAAALEA